jgi:hypothetical protein
VKRWLLGELVAREKLAADARDSSGTQRKGTSAVGSRY